MLVGSLSVVLAQVADVQVVRIAEAAPAANLDRLYATIRNDSAYKVRMQAIRVLARRLDQAKAKAPDEAIDVLSAAARADENYLVRGLACFSLGRLADARGRAPLTAALRDSHPFVRAQAEEGLKVLEALQPKTPSNVGARDRGVVSGAGTIDSSRRSGRVPVLIVAAPAGSGSGSGSGTGSGRGSRTEVATGGGGGFADGFAEYFTDGISRRMDSRFEVVSVQQASDTGYRVTGSVADPVMEPLGNGLLRVTLTVRVSISTMPENNLRHVISAKASAQIRKGQPIKSSLRRQLLHAATDKAIADSLAQLGGG